MTAVSCVRISEVEAARDGRLTGAERKSFERHLPLCADCREEDRKLNALADCLRAVPAPEPDEMASRRRRQQLLLEADRQVVAGTPAPRRFGLVFAVVVAAALLLFVGQRFYTRRPASVATVPTANAEIATIRAAEGARWSKARDGLIERIDLQEGELAIAVHGSAGEHVVVKLPDGELEDLGTRFIVVVQAGATKQVVVQEGLVVLRLRDRAPVHIGAGSSWVRETPAVASASLIVPPITSAPLVAAPKMKLAPSAEPSDIDVPGAELKVAMGSYRSGNHREAAAKFAAFIQAHPGDARSEDASYLRIVALQRAGDHAAARVAAKEYLTRYPKGFRVPEVEGMLK